MMSKAVDSVMGQLLTRMKFAVCAPMRFPQARFPQPQCAQPQSPAATALGSTRAFTPGNNPPPLALASPQLCKER
jgi:hypothetical protein